MLLNADTINGVAAIAGVVSVGLAIWSVITSKKVTEAHARNQNSALLADQAERKLTHFGLMLKRPGNRPLKVLSELEFEELGSDRSIRSTLDRIEMLNSIDPWEGQAAAIKHVDLVRFFSYVTKAEINLATEDVSVVARKVLRMGEGLTEEVYRRQRRIQRVLAALSAFTFVSMMVWAHATDRLHLSLNGETPGIDSTSPGQNPEQSETRQSSGAQVGDTSDSTPSTIPQPGDHRTDDPEGVERWKESVAPRVAGTRELMDAMNDSITHGAYIYAIEQLREARSRMGDLQSQSSPYGGSQEVGDIIRDLDAKIDSTVTACRGELLKDLVPRCP